MAPGIKMSVSTNVKLDRKVADGILQRLKGSDRTYVTVGVHEDAGTYEDLTGPDKQPVPVAKVAFWLEYGTRYMPARPFLYSTMQAQQVALARLMAKAEAAVIAGKKTTAQALAAVGFQAQTFIQNAIKSNIGPALTPSYLARRMQAFPEAGSRTLIRTGLLLRSVRWKVFEGGKEVASATDAGPEATAEGTKRARATGRKDMRAERSLRAQQRAKAKTDPVAAKAAFDAQRRVRPRLEPPREGG